MARAAYLIGLALPLIIPVSIIALAAWLFRKAWRGRRVGSEIACSQCGYLLTGTPDDSTRCSECGNGIRIAGGTVKGIRRHRPALMACAVIGIALGFWLAVQPARQAYKSFDFRRLESTQTLLTRVEKQTPTFMQVRSLDSYELSRRLRAGEVSREQADHIVARMLGKENPPLPLDADIAFEAARVGALDTNRIVELSRLVFQFEYNQEPWLLDATTPIIADIRQRGEYRRGEMQFILAAAETKHLSADELPPLLEQAFSKSLRVHARQRANPGGRWPVATEVGLSAFAPGYNVHVKAEEATIAGQNAAVSGDFSIQVDRATAGGSGVQKCIIQIPEAIKPGDSPLKAELTLLVTIRAGANPPHTFRHRSNLRLKLIPPEESAVTPITTPSLEQEIRTTTLLAKWTRSGNTKFFVFIHPASIGRCGHLVAKTPGGDKVIVPLAIPPDASDGISVGSALVPSDTEAFFYVPDSGIAEEDPLINSYYARRVELLPVQTFPNAQKAFDSFRLTSPPGK